MLYGINDLITIAKVCYYSNYVYDENRLSVLYIARPERGKTTIFNRFYSKKTLKVDDISQKTILDYAERYFQTNKYKSMYLPDFVSLANHSYSTVNSTISLINRLVEEGIKDGLFYGLEYHFTKPVKIGMFVPITPNFFIKLFKRFNDIGFLSRFVPISYEYSESTRLSILQETVVKSKTEPEKPVRISAPKIYDVVVPEDIKQALQIQLEPVLKRLNDFKVITYDKKGNRSYITPDPQLGIRLNKKMLVFLKAYAVMQNPKKPQVTYQTLSEVIRLFDYIRYPDNPKMI